MKICLLSDQYSRTLSGIGIHTRGVVKSLADRGHDVTLVCNEKPSRAAVDDGFRYVYLQPHMLDASHGKWLSLFFKSPKLVSKLDRKYGFDIFHSLDARQGALVPKRLSLPSVGNVNDYYFAQTTLNPAGFYRDYREGWMKIYLYYNFTRVFEKLTIHNFDFLIANSEATRAALIDHYGIPPEKVVKIHKALYTFPERRNRLVVKKKGDYFILMVGTNLQRKGIFHVIEAAKSILREFPNARFHFVGNSSDKITETCRKEGVMQNFTFHGPLPRPRVEELFRDADLFLLPSIIEGFGVALLEAISYGIPSIGSSVGGIQEIIKDGRNGLLVRSGSSEEIASAAIRLLSDVSLRERLSRNAFSDAKEFNFTSHVDSIEEIYKRLL